MLDHRDDCAITDTGNCTCRVEPLNETELSRRRQAIEFRLRSQRERMQWLGHNYREERKTRLDLEKQLKTERKDNKAHVSRLRTANWMLLLWAIFMTALFLNSLFLQNPAGL